MPPAQPVAGTTGRTRPMTIAIGIVVVAVTLALGLLGGAWLNGDRDSGTPESAPGTDSVDAGFARDMQAHHAQAVRMSVLVREATDDAEVKTLALDIMLTQQQQAGQMFGWLRTWGLSQSAPARMQWMQMDDMGDMGNMSGTSHGSGGMAMSDGTMPGMATEAQLQRLSELTGDAAERLYLRLLIPHHRGGVDMARYAVQNATEPEVRSLAEGIVTAQSAEIEVLRSMLRDRQR